jgi:hydroxymethylpyrimidine pyrophosphatase-like HAD family hydrolase
MKDALLKLDFVVISGATRGQMQYQLDGVPCELMAQNGNDTDYWKNEIKDFKEIYAHMLNLHYGVFSNQPDLVENRGSQITLSMIGHHTPLEIKKAYDPDKKKRKALLKKFPFKSDKFDCVIAGTTCFDYFLKGMNKGTNIKRLIALKNWRSDECLYIGDALFKGGNDESVIGVIPTKSVKNPEETLTFINGL